jgi:5-methylcytosine-specific restriction endonuclease McrA
MGETFERRLRAEMERMWKSGSREGTSEQRAHDAFVSMLEGKGRPGRRPDFVAVYDMRTHSTHIPGVGPLDEEATRAAARDAIVWAVLHDGQKVSDIIRFGDYVPRPLEVLLEIGDPPHFEGVRCADCGATFAFERDHVNPRANGGPTSNANLEPRCPPCHRAKTERDREAGLLGKNPPRRRPGGGRSRPKRASAARGAGTSRAGP